MWNFLEIVFLQCLFFSNAIIGISFYLIIKKKHRKKLEHFIQKQSIFGTLFLFTALGTVFLGTLLVPFYALNLSASLFEKVYILLSITSITVLLIKRLQLLEVVKLKENKRIILALVFIILTDYLITLIYKAPLLGDAPVHIARVNYILNNGYSIRDPYFSKKGLIDTRYSYNTLLGLMAVYARILSKNAVWVWEYSYAYTRLIIFLGIFTALWNIFKQEYKKYFSYITLAISPLILNNFFSFSNFPDRFVFAWIPLFIIGVLEVLENNNYIFLLISSTLIALIHPLYATMALAFIILCFLFTRKLFLLRRLPIIVSFCILALSVLSNLLIKNYAKTNAAGFNSNPISGSQYFVKNIWFFKIGYLHNQLTFYVISVLLYFIFFSIIHSYILRKKVFIFYYLLSTFLGILLFNLYWLSILGYFVIIQQSRNKTIVALLLLFFFLFVYNPFFITAVDGRVQKWAIERIQEFNFLSLIAPFIALAYWINIPFKKLGVNTPLLVAALSTCAILVVESNFLNTISLVIPSQNLSKIQSNIQRVASLNELEQLSDLTENKTIYANRDISILVPDVSKNTNIIAINVNNYSLSANTALHESCEDTISEKFDYSDLRAAGVSEIILTRYESELYKTYLNKSYIQFIRSAGNLNIYRIRSIDQNEEKSICSIPNGQ